MTKKKESVKPAVRHVVANQSNALESYEPGASRVEVLEALRRASTSPKPEPLPKKPEK